MVERVEGAVYPLQKTASGSLESDPNKRAYYDPLLVPELQRDFELWGYDLGLGVDVGPNLYAYVRQNPWSYYDPYGLELFGYDTAGDYFSEVGEVWKGYGDSIASTASGTWEAVTNPGAVVDGVVAMASDPKGTAQGAWNGVKQAGSDLASGDARKQGNVIGGILQSAVPASKAKMLSKLPGGNKKGGGADGGDPSNGAGPSGSGKCFPEGTLVLTPEGYEEIEDVDEGEFVVAYDEETGELVAREVIKVVRGTTHYWVDIDFGVETVTATRGHRFWVESEGDWIAAINLKPGMTLREEDGEIRTVLRTYVREIAEAESTFNFEVAEEHNYFVGLSSVLVHNGDKDDIDILRGGSDVTVSSVEKARGLIDQMPDISPGTNSPYPVDSVGEPHKIQTPYDPPGTYRGDLIDKKDPNQAPDHKGKKGPHYNIKFPDGTKGTIMIDDPNSLDEPLEHKKATC